MKNFFSSILEKKQEELKNIEKSNREVARLNKIIQAFQEYCPHKHPDGTNAMKFIGNDSHKHFYICEICKLETEE